MINKIQNTGTLTDYLKLYGNTDHTINCTYGIPELEFVQHRLDFLGHIKMWTGLTTDMKRVIRSGNLEGVAFTIRYTKLHSKYIVIIGQWSYCTDIFKYPKSGKSITIYNSNLHKFK